MSSAGKWEITHWKGGHPVWCQIHHNGVEVLQGVHHKDLHDLKYTVERAILEVRAELPEPYKHEMD